MIPFISLIAILILIPGFKPISDKLKLIQEKNHMFKKKLYAKRSQEIIVTISSSAILTMEKIKKAFS